MKKTESVFEQCFEGYISRFEFYKEYARKNLFKNKFSDVEIADFVNLNDKIRRDSYKEIKLGTVKLEERISESSNKAQILDDCKKEINKIRSVIIDLIKEYLKEMQRYRRIYIVKDQRLSKRIIEEKNYKFPHYWVFGYEEYDQVRDFISKNKGETPLLAICNNMMLALWEINYECNGVQVKVTVKSETEPKISVKKVDTKSTAIPPVYKIELLVTKNVMVFLFRLLATASLIEDLKDANKRASIFQRLFRCSGEATTDFKGVSDKCWGKKLTKQNSAQMGKSPEAWLNKKTREGYFITFKGEIKEDIDKPIKFQNISKSIKKYPETWKVKISRDEFLYLFDLLQRSEIIKTKEEDINKYYNLIDACFNYKFIHSDISIRDQWINYLERHNNSLSAICKQYQKNVKE